MSVDVNEKTITEEQKDNIRFEELNKIPETERTDEQKKELGELKEHYGKRMQKKIDTMTFKTKTLEEEVERLRKENEEIKSKPPVEKEIVTENAKSEIIEINGKKYFTDKALIAQINAKEITDDEAYNYQRKRDKEEIKEELRKEHRDEEQKVTDINIRKEDRDNVLKEYPNFSKTHPDFNPEDSLYKLSNELYIEAYAINPKGLSLAIKRAKEILRISDNIDRSEDLDIEKSDASERIRNDRKKEITLTEGEKEAAIRQWTRGDVKNPKTGRAYTANEALIKALNAKKERIQK